MKKNSMIVSGEGWICRFFSEIYVSPECIQKKIDRISENEANW